MRSLQRKLHHLWMDCAHNNGKREENGRERERWGGAYFGVETSTCGARRLHTAAMVDLVPRSGSVAPVMMSCGRAGLFSAADGSSPVDSAKMGGGGQEVEERWRRGANGWRGSGEGGDEPRRKSRCLFKYESFRAPGAATRTASG